MMKSMSLNYACECEHFYKENDHITLLTDGISATIKKFNKNVLPWASSRSSSSMYF